MIKESLEVLNSFLSRIRSKVDALLTLQKGSERRKKYGLLRVKGNWSWVRLFTVIFNSQKLKKDLYLFI